MSLRVKAKKSVGVAQSRVDTRYVRSIPTVTYCMNGGRGLSLLTISATGERLCVFKPVLQLSLS